MRRKIRVVRPRTWTVTIHHSGPDLCTYTSREQVVADTDTEAVVVALLRTGVERASLGTRVVQIDVG